MLKVCLKMNSRMAVWSPVESLEDASHKVREEIERNDIGSRAWTGGDVVDDDGNYVAWVSYNGRIWNPSTKHGREAFERYLSTLDKSQLIDMSMAQDDRYTKLRGYHSGLTRGRCGIFSESELRKLIVESELHLRRRNA